MTTPLSSNDEELRDKIVDAIMYGEHSGLADDDVHTIPNMDIVMNLISEDRKAREAEIDRLARIDEINKMVQAEEHIDNPSSGKDFGSFAAWSYRDLRLAELQPQADKDDPARDLQDVIDRAW